MSLSSQAEERQRELWRLYQKDPRNTKIEGDLINSYEPFIYTTVRKFRTKITSSASVDILMQAGRRGLLQALRSFEPERGYTFTTFAHPAIVNELIEENNLDQGSIRVPDYINRLRGFLSQAYKLFAVYHGRRHRSVKELATWLEFPPASLRAIIVACKRHVHEPLHGPSLVDGEDYEREIVDSQPSPEDIAIQTVLHELITSAMDSLHPDQKQAIELYLQHESFRLAGEIAFPGRETRAVATMLNRCNAGIKKLREHLEGEGIQPLQFKPKKAKKAPRYALYASHFEECVKAKKEALKANR